MPRRYDVISDPPWQTQFSAGRLRGTTGYHDRDLAVLAPLMRSAQLAARLARSVPGERPGLPASNDESDAPNRGQGVLAKRCDTRPQTQPIILPTLRGTGLWSTPARPGGGGRYTPKSAFAFRIELGPQKPDGAARPAGTRISAR